MYTGFLPYLENLEFCKLLFQAWKMPGFCAKSGKNINLKPGKNLVNYVCQDSLFKMTFSKKVFTSLSYLHYQHKQNDSKPKSPVISLFLPGNNLENTWYFMSPEKLDPCYSTLSECLYIIFNKTHTHGHISASYKTFPNFCSNLHL